MTKVDSIPTNHPISGRWHRAVLACALSAPLSLVAGCKPPSGAEEGANKAPPPSIEDQLNSPDARDKIEGAKRAKEQWGTKP